MDEHHRGERLKRELLWMANDELGGYLEAEPTERPRKLGKRQDEHDLLELLGMGHIHDIGVRFLTPEELFSRLKEEPQDGEEPGPFG